MPDHWTPDEVLRVLRMHYDSPRLVLPVLEDRAYKIEEELTDYDKADLIGEDEPHEGT